ncbi:MAG: STAS domain-containing protein [Rhodocyclaceae bacterium]|nr:STAS domain-containing protein [Rhodocyclaceae bacterium]
MTIASAKVLLAEGVDAIANSCTQVDLVAVSAVDSSALAVVFGWIRAAKALGRSIRIVNAPKSLLSLADVYGVAELLPLD